MMLKEHLFIIIAAHLRIHTPAKCALLLCLCTCNNTDYVLTRRKVLCHSVCAQQTDKTSMKPWGNWILSINFMVGTSSFPSLPPFPPHPFPSFFPLLPPPPLPPLLVLLLLLFPLHLLLPLFFPLSLLFSHPPLPTLTLCLPSFSV